MRATRHALIGFVKAHPILWVGLLLLVLDLLLVYPAVLGGRVLAPEDSLLFNAPFAAGRPASLAHPSNYLLADAIEVFHPDLEWARTMVRAGHVPLWNPDAFAGWPEFASQQTAMLYPLTLLAYVLPFWQALGLIAVLKTLLGGLGMWWLCRRLKLGVAASILAAVCYSLGSYFVVWLEHPQTNVYALIPWLLGAIELACARRRIADAGLLAAIAGACLLGGHLESAFIAGLAGLPFAVLCLTELDARARRRAGGLLAGAALLALAAGLVMLVPFAQMAGQATELARGGGSGMPDRSILSLILPDLWGRPDSTFEGAGPVNYVERTIYLGALPLMLALAGLYRVRGRRQLFFVGLLCVAFVFAVHVPLLSGALDGLPGFSEVDLVRALILVVLSLAVLAAYGLQRVLDGSEHERRAALVLASIGACIPLAWLVAHSDVLHEFPRFTDLAPSLWGTSSTQAQTGAAAVTRWLLFALCGLAILWLLDRSLRRARQLGVRLALALALALVAADLLALNHGFHPAVPESRVAPPATPSLVSARADQGHGRVVGYDEYLIPNVASRYGLRDARGHGLPALARYLALWNGLGGFGFQATRLRPGDPRAAQLLDDFGVNLLLAAPGEQPPQADLRSLAGTPDGTVYANAQALPRAYVATSWRGESGRRDALAATLASSPSELRSTPVIEGVRSVSPTSAARGHPGGASAAFTTDGASTVALDVDSPEAGYLVLLDTYYPGWSATVDGHAAVIHPANEDFRAVAVPAGRHHVVFRYRPRAIIFAAAISALAWIAILVLIFVPRIAPSFGRRRPGRSSTRPPAVQSN